MGEAAEDRLEKSTAEVPMCHADSVVHCLVPLRLSTLATH